LTPKSSRVLAKANTVFLGRWRKLSRLLLVPGEVRAKVRPKRRECGLGQDWNARFPDGRRDTADVEPYCIVVLLLSLCHAEVYTSVSIQDRARNGINNILPIPLRLALHA
jgi:hypothetical protein